MIQGGEQRLKDLIYRVLLIPEWTIMQFLLSQELLWMIFHYKDRHHYRGLVGILSPGRLIVIDFLFLFLFPFMNPQIPWGLIPPQHPLVINQYVFIDSSFFLQQTLMLYGFNMLQSVFTSLICRHLRCLVIGHDFREY